MSKFWFQDIFGKWLGLISFLYLSGFGLVFGVLDFVCFFLQSFLCLLISKFVLFYSKIISFFFTEIASWLKANIPKVNDLVLFDFFFFFKWFFFHNYLSFLFVWTKCIWHDQCSMLFNVGRFLVPFTCTKENSTKRIEHSIRIKLICIWQI